jgi:hypothetical protein
MARISGTLQEDAGGVSHSDIREATIHTTMEMLSIFHTS